MEAPATTFDESKLRSFVVAFLQVNEINRTYLPQMQEADSTEGGGSSSRSSSRPRRRWWMAVENAEGIDVDEYNAITESAQANPELASQLNQMIQQAASE